MLTPTLTGPVDVFHKLQREQHRTLHSYTLLHLADHLYNFCVTALALRDFVHSALSHGDDLRNGFRQAWSEDPKLCACSEIANASKHGKLRRAPSARDVALANSTWVTVLVDNNGSLAFRPERDHPDAMITGSDGVALSVAELTKYVVAFWRTHLQSVGIAVTEQSEAELFDGRGTG
jgi:hypothetical protein